MTQRLAADGEAGSGDWFSASRPTWLLGTWYPVGIIQINNE